MRKCRIKAGVFRCPLPAHDISRVGKDATKRVRRQYKDGKAGCNFASVILTPGPPIKTNNPLQRDGRYGTSTKIRFNSYPTFDPGINTHINLDLSIAAAVPVGKTF